SRAPNRPTCRSCSLSSSSLSSMPRPPGCSARLRWLRLSEQFLRIDRWIILPGLGCQAEGQRFAVSSIGRHAVKARVRASCIVKAEVTSDRRAGVADAVVGPQVHFLVLDAAPQTFDEHVVPPSALAVHADRNVVVGEHARERRALVGVEDVRLAVTSQSILQGLDAERCFHCDRYTPRQHATAEPIEHDGQIDEATCHRDVGDVHCPHLVRPDNLHSAQQIRIDLVPGLGLRRPRMAIECFYPHPLHQRLHVTSADLAPLGSQQASQHARAGEGKIQMQPIEMPHDLQVGRRHLPRQVVHAATADAQGFRLLADRKIVLAHDHRLALSKPALPSATSKKAFSIVSSPILAWSDFTSIGGGLAPVPAPDPNTPAAPSWSCVFHCVIWLGCTSKCCASSVTVFWPLIAANATFALNAGVWFRRARLLIVSPDSSGTACPLSGRNSTYPPVQISGAGSFIRTILFTLSQ